MADEEKDKPAEPEKPAVPDASAEDKYKTRPLSAMPTEVSPGTEATKPEAPKPAAPAVEAKPDDKDASSGKKAAAEPPTDPNAEQKPEAKPAGADSKPPAKPSPKPVVPAAEGATDAKPAAEAKVPADKPAPKPAAKAPPKKPAEVETIAIPDDALVVKLKGKFPDAVLDAKAILKQKVISITRDALLNVCRYLRDDSGLQFNLLVDLTAVHYPSREKKFEAIYILYSVANNDRIRLKVSLDDGESIPSVSSLWSTANWLEREAFDMFGIRFEGHPDMRRILLPEDWVGYPLRKEYPIEYEDNAWVAKHLNIRPLPAAGDYKGKFE
jgi:NADH-quinone oxidoreductase subunit C